MAETKPKKGAEKSKGAPPAPTPPPPPEPRGGPARQGPDLEAIKASLAAKRPLPAPPPPVTPPSLSMPKPPRTEEPAPPPAAAAPTPAPEPAKAASEPAKPPAAAATPAPKPAAPPAADKPAAPPKPVAAPPAPRPKTESDDVKALMARFTGLFTHLDDTDPRIPTVQLNDRMRLVEVAEFLMKDRHMEHLALITGVDYKTHLEVVYNFWSYSRNVPVEVKVRLDPKDAKVPSLTPLWATADWHERENWDLMGIQFEGHPNLKRILLPEGWKGHPLRKDYDSKKEQYVGLDPVGGEDLVFQERREGAW